MRVKKVVVLATLIFGSIYLQNCRTADKSSASAPKDFSDSLGVSPLGNGQWRVLCKDHLGLNYTEVCSQKSIEDNNVCLGIEYHSFKTVNSTFLSFKDKNCALRQGLVVRVQAPAFGTNSFPVRDPATETRSWEVPSRFSNGSFYGVTLGTAINGCDYANPGSNAYVLRKDVEIITGPKARLSGDCVWTDRVGINSFPR